jgi:predicted Fe-Mo cluster-binding NifX family protein
MNVAIPTNDSVKISSDILSCTNYLIFELEDHTLVNYHKIENPYANDKIRAEEEISNTLSECKTIICNKIPNNVKMKLKASNKQILVTLEENAKKALVNLMCRV